MKKSVLLLLTVLLFLGQSNGQEIKKMKITELEALVNKSDAPLIINFWASFCIPCLKEMPYFEELVKKYKDSGIRLLFVSLDLDDVYPEGLSTIIEKRKIQSPVIWLDETNADYFCPIVDKSWTGAIPATLFVNNKKGYRQFYENEFKKEALETEIKKMVDY